jgi:cystine transport system permease protein
MVAIAYIELFRGTPLLVQLIVFFAAVPVLTGIYLAPWPTAVLAITLNSGSYLAESYRSGVNAVPYGQREAALSLGIPTLRIWTRVILPQAVRIILPSIGTILVSILMGTSFAYLVGVVDLMARATGLYAISNDFSVYYLTTLLYAVAAVVLAIGFSMLERRLRLQ